MSKHNLRYLRNEVIEQVTAQRIREYESKSCTAVTLFLGMDKADTE